MSNHHRRRANAIPVRQFLAGASASTRADNTAWHAATAMTAATAMALAFTPAITHAPALHMPTITAPSIHLTALVDPAAITALQNAVNTELANLDSTVATIVGVPGQTLATALSAAASLSTTFWQALAAAAGNNPLLTGALTSLRNLTSGGLTALASTVTTANTTIVLSTEQVSTLLT